MNNKILITLILGLLVLNGCDTISYKIIEKKVSMEISQKYYIENQYLSYNGIINNEIFSISHIGRNAVNIYYPINVTEFKLYNHNFNLRSINSTNLVISYFINKTIRN